MSYLQVEISFQAHVVSEDHTHYGVIKQIDRF